jgi:hypothetical protein
VFVSQGLLDGRQTFQAAPGGLRGAGQQLVRDPIRGAIP